MHTQTCRKVRSVHARELCPTPCYCLCYCLRLRDAKPGTHCRYATTSKALALLLRKRVYNHLESGLQFFNEKSGWTEVEKVCMHELVCGYARAQWMYPFVRV